MSKTQIVQVIDVFRGLWLVYHRSVHLPGGPCKQECSVPVFLDWVEEYDNYLHSNRRRAVNVDLFAEFCKKKGIKLDDILKENKEAEGKGQGGTSSPDT